jgi:hypothetical protein
MWFFHVDAAERMVRELDAREPDWRWEGLQAARPEVPAAENAAPMLVALGAEIPNGWAAHEDYAGLLTLVANQPPEAELRAQMRLDLQTPPVDRLRAQWRALPRKLRGRVDVTLSEVVTETPLSEHDRLRTLANLGFFDALDAIETGDRAGALAGIERLLSLVSILDEDPFRVVQNIRARLLFECIRLIERYLAHGAATDAELVHLGRLLEPHLDGTRNRASLRGERWMTNQMMVDLRAGRLPNRVLEEPLAMLKPSGDTFWEWWTTPSLAAQAAKDHPVLLEFLNRLVEIEDLPLKDQPAAERALDHDQRSRRTPLLIWLISNQFPINNKARDALCAARTMHALLGVERYRLRHGKWPAKLDDCVPAFLDQVPMDPMADRPLRFRLTDEGVLAYCVGNDGSDDGGDSTKDVMYRLWNPDRRANNPMER